MIMEHVWRYNFDPQTKRRRSQDLQAQGQIDRDV